MMDWRRVDIELHKNLFEFQVSTRMRRQSLNIENFVFMDQKRAVTSP